MPPPAPSSRLLDALDMARTALSLHLSGTWRIYATIIVALFIVSDAWLVFVSPPARFSSGFVTIESGTSLGSIADSLAQDTVIRQPIALKAILRLEGRDGRIQAGMYLFPHPLNVFQVAWRLGHGETGVEPVRITFPEGMASFDMGRALAAALPGFDGDLFTALAEAQWEGYLFPDTYFFLPGTTPQQVIDRMVANYETQRESFADDLAASPHSEHEIITMASIVEREAATPEDRRIVAGILWKRIALPMRLQVDAPFGYLHEDMGYVPTSEDTSEDSPYNTYRHDGLPPGPIANPGLDAIEATLHPTESDYLYYLTGKDGTMHYAKTFAEHKANVLKYL